MLKPTSATLLPMNGVSRPYTGGIYGLPVIGFMVYNLQNSGVQSNYGGMMEHKFSHRIE